MHDYCKHPSPCRMALAENQIKLIHISRSCLGGLARLRCLPEWHTQCFESSKKPGEMRYMAQLRLVYNANTIAQLCTLCAACCVYASRRTVDYQQSGPTRSMHERIYRLPEGLGTPLPRSVDLSGEKHPRLASGHPIRAKYWEVSLSSFISLPFGAN